MQNNHWYIKKGTYSRFSSIALFASVKMARKRLYEDLLSIEEPVSTAEVQCVVQSLSDMKKAKSGVEYYDGIVTDGNRQLCIVGFDRKHKAVFRSIM